MFEVHSTVYGICVCVRGTLTTLEAARLKNEVQRVLAQIDKPFGAVIDARDFRPRGPDTESAWLSNTQSLDEAGRQRTAAIVNKATTKIQMERHIKELRRGRTHRILLCCHDDLESCPCLRMAESWVRDGVEPPEESADDD